MTRYLVVGANGTIGSALFKQLKTQGADVWGTAQRNVNCATIFHLNLSEPLSQWQFPTTHFDVVFLCAGICRIAPCEDNPIATRQVNVEGMAQLARLLAQNGAFIVYLSTNQVFSGNKPQVLAEDLQQPMNEYGRQKSAMEALLIAHRTRTAIVRLTKVMEPNMLLLKNWKEQLKLEQPIEAFCDMMLAPVHINQVIRVLLAIGEKKQPGSYQLSGREDFSYYDLARFIAHDLSYDPALVQGISALDRGMKKNFLPQFTTLDCSSTIALCSESPPSFSEVIRECVACAS